MKKKVDVEKIYFVEFRRVEKVSSPNKSKVVKVRFIGKLEGVAELGKNESKDEVYGYWRKYIGLKPLPKYGIMYERENVLWSSEDALSMPIRLSRGQGKSTTGAVTQILRHWIFADVVKEISAKDVESEVEKWKLMSSL
jgi:hypothetical protein